MKGKILKKILEFLEEGAINQIDFVEAVLSAGYGASMGKIEYEYQKNRRNREKTKIQREELMAKKLRLQKFLSKLKKDGLIIEEKNNLKISISQKGKEKLQKLKTSQSKYYKKETSSGLVIISFDIPERLRGKRNWVREVIKNLDFEMIHKSVWAGKTKIPRELISYFSAKNLLQYIEIFEVNRTGSLEKVGK